MLIPSGRYNGQKLIKLVSVNTAAKTNSTIPIVPYMIFVKNAIAITKASTKRIILSNEPIFFFMILFFLFNYLIVGKLIL